MIDLKNVSKAFGKRKVLSDVSLTIAPNEFVCIIGPSGAGKTTLMHILAAADTPSSGNIEIDGMKLENVPPSILRLFRRRVGVVFQDYRLLAHFTVRENISFPLEVCGVPAKQMKDRVNDVLKQLELTEQADLLPKELSGGEQARTAIARAIVHDPMILIADEPTGNLDPDQSLEILSIFQKIHKGGTTVILATHDAELVNSLKTRVVILEDGSITQDKAGGYKRKKKANDHDILEENPAPPPPARRSSKSEGGKKSASAKKRKVRVTAVNGNGH